MFKANSARNVTTNWKLNRRRRPESLLYRSNWRISWPLRKHRSTSVPRYDLVLLSKMSSFFVIDWRASVRVLDVSLFFLSLSKVVPQLYHKTCKHGLASPLMKINGPSFSSFYQRRSRRVMERKVLFFLLGGGDPFVGVTKYLSTLKKSVGNRDRIAGYFALLLSTPWQLCSLFSNSSFLSVLGSTKNRGSEQGPEILSLTTNLFFLKIQRR